MDAATAYLHTVRIPKAAEKIIEQLYDHVQANLPLLEFPLARLMHLHGVNMRHIGKLYTEMKSVSEHREYSEDAMLLCVIEMCICKMKSSLLFFYFFSKAEKIKKEQT